MTSYRLGAIFYVLWGIMHIMFAVQIFILNIDESTYSVIKNIYLDSGNKLTPTELGNVVGAIMNQHAWNLLWFGTFATIIGALYNWHNSLVGYWGNLIVVSLADIGFIAAVLIPGYVDPLVGIWGPILWIAATVSSTIGLKRHTVMIDNERSQQVTI